MDSVHFKVKSFPINSVLGARVEMELNSLEIRISTIVIICGRETTGCFTIHLIKGNLGCISNPFNLNAHLVHIVLCEFILGGVDFTVVTLVRHEVNW